MKASYDPHTDTLSFQLRPKVAVAESDEPRPGIILDLDAEGNIISLEILDASMRVTDADRMEFETIGSG